MVIYQTIAYAQSPTLWHLSSEKLREHDDLSKTGVVFVAPLPGVLKIFPDSVIESHSSTPTSASISVVRGIVTDTTTVLRYFTCRGIYVGCALLQYNLEYLIKELAE